MKFKLIILSLLILSFSYGSQAQNSKNSNDNTEQGENTGKKKKKKQKKNQSSSLAGMPGMKTIPAKPDNNIKLPDSYSFSYTATMRIENSKGVVEPVFYLQPDAPYYARKQANDEGLIEYLVLDNQNSITLIFAELDGEKRRMHNRINLQTKATLMGAYRDVPQKEPIKTIESKIILGYNCQGYQIATEVGTTRLWITDEAPASLFSTMFSQRTNDSGKVPFNNNSMIMKIDFISAGTPEKNYQMECTQLQPETLVLNMKEYQEAL